MNIKYIIISLLFVSCNMSKKGYIDYKPGEVPVLNFRDDIQVNDYLKNIRGVKYIQLETTDKCLLSDIVKVEVQDDYLVILDKLNKIYLFNKSTGLFIRQIGSIGQGSGEYISTNSICLSPDKQGVYIYDIPRGSICLYNWNGEIVYQKRLFETVGEQEINKFIALPGNQLVVNTLITPRNMLGGNVMENYNQLHIDINLDSVVNVEIPITAFRHNDCYGVYLRNPNNLYNEQLSIIKPACDTIFNYDYSESKRMFPRYKIQLPDSYKYPTADLLHGGDKLPEESLLILTRSGYFSGFVGMFETANMVFFQTASFMDGFALADKNTLEGILIPYGWNNDFSLNAECERVLRGEGIFEVKAAQSSEFISILDGTYMYVLNSVLQNNKDIVVPPDLNTVLENYTEDSNPCIVIYEV